MRSDLIRLAVTVGAVAVSLAGAGDAHADPDALWRLVSQQCVVDELQFGNPEPCAAVDLTGGVQRGYAVLKDAHGARQFLLIPTARITGVESPELISPEATNYFDAAWQVRSYFEEAAGGPVPRDWVSLAVNSRLARSQEQLHIHIDCLRADVHDALTRYGNEVGPEWSEFPLPLAGHRYSALAVEGDKLDVNPFRLVADRFGGHDMELQTLVVVGSDSVGRGSGGPGRQGFVILVDRADGENGDFAGGEQLQDHDSCLAPRS